MRGQGDHGSPARVYGKQEGASFQVIILVSTMVWEGQKEMVFS